jgi:hypothetical protein
MLSSLFFLVDELKQNGIAADIPELVQYPNILGSVLKPQARIGIGVFQR